MIRAFNGIQPQIDPTAFIAETATIIGDVHIGCESSIWYNVVARGDVNSIRIGARTNIQDLSVLHVTGRKNADHPGNALVIGDDVTIGHSVTIHGCRVEAGAFIGMKSLLMDGVIIGASAMIGAGSVVTPGTIIPAQTLWMGSPARFKRELTPLELARAAETGASYIRLASQYRLDVFQ